MNQGPPLAYIDPYDVSPDYYKTLFDNETLGVVEMTLPAGHKDTEHPHPNETVYFIKGGKVRIYVADESMEADIPDGHVMHHEAGTHTVENIGDTDIHAILFEPHMDVSGL
jgi:mannose-6-phosphate isomerase-like protein (cupin superfamily)